MADGTHGRRSDARVESTVVSGDVRDIEVRYDLAATRHVLADLDAVELYNAREIKYIYICMYVYVRLLPL